VIRSFKNIGTEDIFYGKNTKVARRICPQNLWKVAGRKLDQLDSVDTLDQLRIPPGNRLEELSGGRKGQYSIRINEQYRICFVWAETEPDEVEIVDYHWVGIEVDKMIRVPTHRTPTHPGEMLLEEFLIPMGLTQQDLANAIRVPYQRVNELINGRRGMTPSTALRLEKFFGMSASFWLNLQLRWDLYFAQQKEKNALESIEPYQKAA
jgi:antitoxin HigA-1